MNNKVSTNTIEALLFGAGRPLRLSEIRSLLENNGIIEDLASIKQSINEIEDRYDGTSLEIKDVASGYRIQIKKDFSGCLSHLWNENTPRISKALMETISIIAYKQPVTRGDIEDIRGVSVNPQIIRNMIEFEWIKVVGHKETPGKPELLATTKKFLDYFNLKTLSDLPPPSELNTQ